MEFQTDGDKTRMTLTDGPYPGGAGHAENGLSAAMKKLGERLGG